MGFSGCFLCAQTPIPRERCEVLWFISTKDELLSQRWSQDMTISVTKNKYTDENTTFRAYFVFRKSLEMDMMSLLGQWSYLRYHQVDPMYAGINVVTICNLS